MFRYLHRAAVARTYAHVVTQTFSRRLTDVSNITNPVKMSGVKPDGKTLRFYKNVGIDKLDFGYALKLGGRFVLTPSHRLFVVPTEHIAYAVAHEWDSQQRTIKPGTMPINHIAVMATDQVPDIKALLMKHILGGAETDYTCQRAEDPAALVKLQKKHWDPLMNYAAKEFGIALKPAYGVMPSPQPAESLLKAREWLAALDDWRFAAFDTISETTKSFLISLALFHNRITVDQAFEAAHLDETFQMKQYGEVHGAFGHGINIAYIKLKLAAGRTVLDMLDLENFQAPASPVKELPPDMRAHEYTYHSVMAQAQQMASQMGTDSAFGVQHMPHLIEQLRERKRLEDEQKAQLQSTTSLPSSDSTKQ